MNYEIMKKLINGIKIIPVIMASLICLCGILGLLGVVSISCLCSTSIIVLLFMYYTSYTLKFSNYHRCFIHYLTLCTGISIINYILPIPSTIVYIALIIAFVLTLVYSIIYKFKNK